MSAGVESGGNSQDFDLNLAPIIDCFTVLIAFMLASAGYLALAVMDAQVAANTGAGNDQTPPSIRIDIELTMQKELSLKVEGKMTLAKKIPPKGDAYDAAAVIAEIKALRGKYPDVKGLILTAADDVQYTEIVGMMEQLKKHIPSILLGGL